jgi:hypothetical protein
VEIQLRRSWILSGDFSFRRQGNYLKTHDLGRFGMGSTSEFRIKSVNPWRSRHDRGKRSTYIWHEPHQLKPGNANLPIGGLHNAIQKNGVPGQHLPQLFSETGVEPDTSKLHGLAFLRRAGPKREGVNRPGSPPFYLDHPTVEINFQSKRGLEYLWTAEISIRAPSITTNCSIRKLRLQPPILP